MAVNISTSFTDANSNDAIQSFYNTELLIRASFHLIHQIPVKKHTLGMRKGKTMMWRRYTNMTVATTALTEGVNPAGAAKAKTDVSVTLSQYGDFIEDSDMLLDTQPEAVTTENVSLLGQQMGETFDALYRNGLAVPTTNIIYTNGSSTVTVSQIIDRNDLDRAYRLLRQSNAKPFTPMILSGQNQGTGSVMPAYWGLCDEDLAFDLRHVEGFLQVSDYPSQKGVLNGEIGADKNGIRILASPSGFVLAGATGTTIAATDVQNTSSFADIYSLFIMGQNAFGGVNLANKNGGIIRKALGSAGTADPLEMRATVGWKKYDARTALNANFMCEVQSAASL